MCLAVPVEVVAVADGVARVNVGCSETFCAVDAVPGVRTGDYILMHAGHAIAVVDVREAEETLRLLKEAYCAEGSQEVLRSGPESDGSG